MRCQNTKLARIIRFLLAYTMRFPALTLLLLLFSLCATPLPGVEVAPKIKLREQLWRLEVDESTGGVDIFYRGRLVLGGVTSAFRRSDASAIDIAGLPCTLLPKRKVYDPLGRGNRYALITLLGDGDTVIRSFTFYENREGFVLQAWVKGSASQSVASITPLSATSGFGVGRSGEGRFLFVPFDNDKWIRYEYRPWGGREIGYEAGAWFSADTRAGLVAGSIEHHVWKTAVITESTPAKLERLTVCCGYTSVETRDTLPHGAVWGREVASAPIFVGWFPDWREGMEAFGEANAQLQKPLKWQGGAPFGWNSWGSIQSKIDLPKAIAVSDAFRELEAAGFRGEGPLYIGLDSYWDNFTDEQLARFVAHCRANGQEAGIYWAPFVDWAKRPSRQIEGSDRFSYADAYLYAHGKPQDLDGAWALDPTHPGVQARIRYFFDRFKRAGFTYIKLDFLTHGSLEADRHFDEKVTTGMQAYNAGMQYVYACLGPDIYITQAISPLFPGGFAHSRRVACDAFASMKDAEYTLNGLAGGWWLNRIYPFNDPDHIVLDNVSEGENRARITTAAITGMLMNGDDLSLPGNSPAKERALQFLTHAPLLEVVKLGQSFRPAFSPQGTSAPEAFVLREGKQRYVALFNFANQTRTLAFDARLLGLSGSKSYKVTELWSGETSKVKGRLETSLGPKDARLYRIEP